MKKILSLFVCMMLLLAIPASAATLSLRNDYNNGHDCFNDDNMSVGIILNTDSDGVLYIYSGERSALSSAPENLLHVAYISASADTIEKDINLSNIGTAYGDYTVEFYTAYPDVEVASSAFRYCSPTEVHTNMGNAILAELKALENPNGLLVENIITSDADRFAMVKSDADLTNYNKVSNKSAIYGKMVSGIANLTSYSDIISLFNKAALNQYKEENTPTDTSEDKKDTTTVMVVGGNSGSGSASGGTSGGTTVTPVPNIPTQVSDFGDMKGHWAEEYAKRLKSLGIMNGYEDGSFRGDNPITRAELAKTLIEAMDIPLNASNASYSDVSHGDWHYEYVLAANNNGLVTGYDDGSFRPDNNVIRQDAALMIYRALSLKLTLSAADMTFADTTEISEYTSEAVASLLGLKIINGDENNCFNPQNELSRAELAALICRSLDCISTK